MILLQVIRLQQNHGVLVELWHVSLGSEEVVPTDLVREPSVTCVVEVACLPQQKHGEDGTEE